MLRGSAPSSSRARLKVDIARLKHSALFDPDYYRQTYPDLVRAGIDPLHHFVAQGAQEGRMPNAFFDTVHYLAANPDVASAGVNPLRHYQEHGWREFRTPSSQFDSRRYFLLHLAPGGKVVDPLAHFLTEGRAAGLEAPRIDHTTGGELRRMAAAAQAAIGAGESSPVEPEMLRLVAQASLASGLGHIAEGALRKLAMQQPELAENHAALAAFEVRNKRWWLVEQSAARAVELDGSRADWLAMLADAQDRMLRLDEAEQSFRQAIALDPAQADLYYRLGHVLERAGKPGEAAESYAKAAELSTDESVGSCGIGVLHQQRGLWEEARDAYCAELARKPDNAELHYRQGMAHDRLYEWDAAGDCYVAAIARLPATRRPDWHFRLGYIRERQGRLAEAAEAYGAAIALHEQASRYWHYRLGFVLEAAGALEQACQVYDTMWPHPEQFASYDQVVDTGREDMTSPQRHFELGASLERNDDLDGAIGAYRAALARSAEFRPEWYFRLGHTLTKRGRLAQACEAFRQTRILQRPHGTCEQEFDSAPGRDEDVAYVEYRHCLPLREDVILYESFNGNALACNPLAIFRTLVDDPDYRDFLHVWVLNDQSRIPEGLRQRENVVFIAKPSDGYLRYLATAKYLINNSGFPPYFLRRAEQKFLATWHGTPLKTLGKEQKYKFYDHRHTQRNFLQASHLITPNPHTTRITLDSYDIRQLATAKLAETGYPRIDLTLNVDAVRKQHLRDRLGLVQGKPVVLYAPTWRGTVDDVQFDTARLEDDLRALAGQGAHLLFRGHSFLEEMLAGGGLACDVVPGDIDTNELLSVVDVLITDYSSVFFDFLPTGRPLLFYIYDQEEYERDRGLYFPMDEMPGYKCRDIGELCAALRTALRDGVADEAAHDAARERFNLHDDGHATRRVIDFFFNDDATLAMNYREAGRPAVVVTAGSLKPNGITTSFLNLMHHVDHGAVDVAFAFSPNPVESSPESLAQLRRLPDMIYAIPRHGRMPLTLEERWLKRLHDDNQPIHSTGLDILRKGYTREFTRILGFRAYDTAICFGGYDPFWAAVQVANDLPMRKVIYLHNNMYGEYRARFPELLNMFRLYPLADKLVSVSEQTSALNRENLVERFGIAGHKFDYCENLSDPEGIKAAAQDDLEHLQDEALFNGEGPVFINLARLSVEKDHEKLIRAFAPIAADNPHSRLLILGGGPLELRLRNMIVELGLTRHVYLLGFRSNPYPYLRRADCFVLSSNHEGQPMTVLEALVLEKPIVATDIAGNRSLLEGGFGLLVNNSVDGLTEGMRAVLNGTLATRKFDVSEYQANALNQFYERVLGLDK